MSIIDTLITTRTAGASYGFVDLNRVGEAMIYVADKLAGVGVAVSISPRTDWTRDDLPQEAALLQYLADLQTLRDSIPVPDTTPQVPAASYSRPYLTVLEANEIEEILVNLNDIIIFMIAAMRHAGAPTSICGGGGTVIQ